MRLYSPRDLAKDSQLHIRHPEQRGNATSFDKMSGIIKDLLRAFEVSTPVGDVSF